MNQQFHPDQRVGIFFDAQNLYHSAKNLYQGRVNYKELIRHLVSGRKLIRAIAYVVKSETASQADQWRSQRAKPEIQRIAKSGQALVGEASFFEALEKAGLELRTKDLQVYPGGFKKADWDVGLAVDAIRMSAFLDAIILVTGDGDFLPLVDYLKWGAGRVVEVAAFGRSTSGKLKEAADRFINIEEIPKVILRK